MGLQKLMLANLLWFLSTFAFASGEIGLVPGKDQYGRDLFKFYFNVYEHLGKGFYLNPYYQYDSDYNLIQHFFRLDLNKHLNDKIILGVGFYNISNNYFDRTDYRVNLIIRLW